VKSASKPKVAEKPLKSTTKKVAAKTKAVVTKPAANAAKKIEKGVAVKPKVKVAPKKATNTTTPKRTTKKK
jgi:hypothetical protein